MIVPSPNLDPAIPILLTGDGLAEMTADRFALLDRMVHGLGLVARRGAEAMPGGVERKDPHAVARELIQLRDAEAALMELVYDGTRDSGSRHGRALERLVRHAFWNPIETAAQTDPATMHEVARCLAVGETETERALADTVTGYVFQTYVERGALDAASSASDVWMQLVAHEGDEGLRIDVQEHVAYTVNTLDAQIAEGHAELQPLRDRLHAAIGPPPSAE